MHKKFVIICLPNTLMKKYFTTENFTSLQKTLHYYRKLYFTTENFTSWKVFFLQKNNWAN